MSLSSFKTLVLTLSLVTFRSGQLQCPKRTLRPTASPTKCVAGRRLYANWSFFKIPGDETGLRRLVPPSWLGVVTTHYAGIKSVCSGALINDRYVLTAQRCVLPPLEPHHVNVGLGNGDYPTRGIILHPNFDHTDPKSSGNDLALLQLPFPLRFSRKLLPLQLVSQKDSLETASQLSTPTTTFGFSQLEANAFKNQFHTFPGTLMRRDDCTHFNQFYNRGATGEVLCSRNVIDASEGCLDLQGLQGAPLTVLKEKRIYRIDVLIGILSWWWPKSKPCTAQENPLVHVNVQEKLPWILNNTRDAQFCRH